MANTLRDSLIYLRNDVAGQSDRSFDADFKAMGVEDLVAKIIAAKPAEVPFIAPIALLNTLIAYTQPDNVLNADDIARLDAPVVKRV